MRRDKLLRSHLLGVLFLVQFCWVRTESNINSAVTPRANLIIQANEAGIGADILVKHPVIVSKTDGQGETTTATYKLSPDDATTTEEKPSHSNDRLGQSLPGNIEAAPALNKGASASPENDWEWATGPLSNSRTYTYSGVRPFTFGNSFPSLFGNHQPELGSSGTGVSTGNSHNGLPSWHNRDWFLKPSFELPPGVTPQTTTKTEVDDQGRTVTTTTKLYKGNLPSNWPPRPSLFGSGDTDIKWPSLRPIFEPPAGVTPQTTTKTEVDDQGRTVTTTTNVYKGTLPSHWPSRPSIFGDTDNVMPSSFDSQSIWNTRPSLFDDTERKVPTPVPLPTRSSNLLPNLNPTASEERKTFTPLPLPTRPVNLVPFTYTSTASTDSLDVKTTTPLPSLEDFLKQQYGSNISVTHYRLDDFTTTPRTLTTINIDDLPTATTTSAINQQPLDDAWLRSLSDPFKADDAAATRTKVTSVSHTYNSPSLPSITDLQPQLRDILTNAGITDPDILNSQDGTVTKERITPDGRLIKTTYRVRTVPISGTLSSFNGGTNGVHNLPAEK